MAQNEKLQPADTETPDWCRDWVPNATPGLGSRYLQHCLTCEEAAINLHADPRPDDDAAKDAQRQRWADGDSAVALLADLMQAESQTDLLDATTPMVEQYNAWREQTLDTLRTLPSLPHEGAEDEQIDINLASRLKAMHYRGQSTNAADRVESTTNAKVNPAASKHPDASLTAEAAKSE